jgi:hypothetical protein
VRIVLTEQGAFLRETGGGSRKEIAIKQAAQGFHSAVFGSDVSRLNLKTAKTTPGERHG